MITSLLGENSLDLIARVLTNDSYSVVAGGAVRNGYSSLKFAVAVGFVITFFAVVFYKDSLSVAKVLTTNLNLNAYRTIDWVKRNLTSNYGKCGNRPDESAGAGNGSNGNIDIV
ncbi:MAG: hypothetical protein QMC90_00125 [Dehalococcoidales bacterium]|nr:hypothetical protein [Dehalococcoidales bacterium]